MSRAVRRVSGGRRKTSHLRRRLNPTIPQPITPRGAFRPLLFRTPTLEQNDGRGALCAVSPLNVLDVEEWTTNVYGDVSRVGRKTGGPLLVIGSVEDVTIAWQRALRADDTPSPCEWTVATGGAS